MNEINKQKFLAELGRLLTFMYEEDRQAALAIYGRMFEEAADEQAMLQFLVSPTRQAVVLARSYDQKERKLQVHAQSRDEDDTDGGETPDFVLAIDTLKREADARGLFAEQAEEVETQDVNQFSLFEQSAPEADADAAATDPYFFDPPQVPASPIKGEPMARTETSPLYDESDTYEAFVEDAPMPEPIIKLSPEAEMDKVDAFFSDYSPESTALPTEAVAITEKQPVDGEANSTPAVIPPDGSLEPEKPQFRYTPPQPSGKVLKPKVGLLILFIIIAAPLTLIGVLLLLVLALLFLAVAIGVVSLGVLAAGAVFSGAGFSMLADILVVSGASLVILAVGMFFAWLFVWFIGGAIVGLVRAVFRLGRQWCYKEVEAQ